MKNENYFKVFTSKDEVYTFNYKYYTFKLIDNKMVEILDFNNKVIKKFFRVLVLP